MSSTINNTVFIFPGQGSQSVGMGKDLASTSQANHFFTKMNVEAGFDLASMMFEGDAAELADTVNTQPALFTHSVAACDAILQANGGKRPLYLAGHSLGQLSATVASGALDFASGLKLVITRGKLMKKAGDLNPGGMAAILGLDIPTLEKVCKEASTATSSVQVANDNCQGQVVISGHKDAVERACAAAKEAGAKRALPLAVSIAAHSLLMDSIQQEWNSAIESFEFKDPSIPLIGNVTAKPLTTAAELKNDLKLQMQSRVRWTETIEWFKQQGISTYAEVGNGAVLAGLIKRIDPEAKVYPASNPNEIANFVQDN